MASPMRKSTFPLDGSCLGSMCKLIFGVWLYVCIFEYTTLGLALLIHDCANEEKRLFESVYANYWIEDSMINVNFVLRTIIELWWTMKPGFLTDSSPVEFLNQVNNKRKKKRDWEEKFMLVFWSLWNGDVYSSKFIMLISCLKFQIANLRTFWITNS